ncbi:MAG: hypothetical protein EAZ57_02955 [Cytophagales bacterium]|nr:MAG: hypothetical protein EAZ67_03420 [Cytophagales bacterium]TAF61718.1 MAG: hypothetical protein EAZ57_02955 [Cytophagales bacterium]
MDNLYIQLIFSFFRLVGTKSELRVFNVSILDKLSTSAKLSGSVLWDDDLIDDVPQDYIWYIPSDNRFLYDTVLLINFIIEHRLIDGDRITITEDELKKKIIIENNWNENKFVNALEYLIKLDIRMVDNGEETASFYVHF